MLEDVRLRASPEQDDIGCTTGGVDAAALAAARAVMPVFCGAQITKLRTLLGLTQTELARRVGITASAVCQAEHGTTTLSAANIASVAATLEVAPEAFTARSAATLSLGPQFRQPRRAAAQAQRMAAQFVAAVAAVAAALRDAVEFPTPPFAFVHTVDPEQPAGDTADRIEHAATQTRAALLVGTDEPVGSKTVELLEQGGVTVVRDPCTPAGVGTYSAVVDGMAVIVLDGAASSVWDRDNFDVAHELGHLVMHRNAGHRPGARTVETQARRFAGAFLAPADALRRELPAGLDWSCYLTLKRRYGMPIVELLRRAETLDVIDAATRTRASKQRSSHGWRAAEPGSADRNPPMPTFLARAAVKADLSPADLAARSHLPETVIRRIVGQPRPTLTG